jgi:hypothetical protein
MRRPRWRRPGGQGSQRQWRPSSCCVFVRVSPDTRGAGV